ncbi:MAG: ribbon-helix-helix domain-containing protein [Terriglobales bacterium]
MVRKGKNHGVVSLKATSAKVTAPPKSKPVALTVKVDDETYVRLCTLRATQRRTNQEILREALHEYLERMAG